MMPSAEQLHQRFEECVESCADSLYRVAFRLTSNSTLASELVQETYLNAWKSLPTIKDPDNLRAWMFSILRNQYSKLIRRESRAVSSVEHLDHVETGPEQRSDEEHRVESIQASINMLEEKHKMPLLLVVTGGMTVDEVASILELPRGTVLSRLHRGRKKLREILIREGHQPLIRGK